MRKLFLASLTMVFLLGLAVLPNTALAGEIAVILDNGEDITVSHLLIKGKTKAFVGNIEKQSLGNEKSIRIAVPINGSDSTITGNTYIFIPSRLLTQVDLREFMSLAKNPNSKLVCSKASINNTPNGFIDDHISADIICGAISLK